MEKDERESALTAAYYLHDVGFLLRERALEAKKAKAAARSPSEREFEDGRLMAYYEVITLMQNQAIAFNLPFDAVGLEGIDPDKDLI